MSGAVEIGVRLPQIGSQATLGAVIEVARAAESMGYDSIWVSDHIALPVDYSPNYPFTPTGIFPVAPEAPILDPFCTLAVAAAVTRGVRLGVSALVVPYRHPVLLAKLAATVDFLSEGRLILGVGVGWHREEFEVLGAPFEDRVGYTRETLDFLKTAWKSSGPVSFEGKYVKLHEVYLNPPPAQGAGLPIWVTGNGLQAAEAVIDFGAAWHCHVFGSEPARLSKELEAMTRRCVAAGRPRPELTLYAPVTFAVDAPDQVGDKDRFWEHNTIRGTPDYVVEVLRQYIQIGVSHLVVRLGDPQGSPVDSLRRFADEVRPRL
jgi:probable F420-dependent oxidoreductase